MKERKKKQDSDGIVQIKERQVFGGFPGGAVVKNLPANAEDKREVCSSPGSGRCPGGGNGNPLQCSCLENPRDRGVWWVSTGLQRGRHDWARMDIGLNGGILQVRPNKMDISWNHTALSISPALPPCPPQCPPSACICSDTIVTPWTSGLCCHGLCLEKIPTICCLGWAGPEIIRDSPGTFADTSSVPWLRKKKG